MSLPANMEGTETEDPSQGSTSTSQGAKPDGTIHPARHADRHADRAQRKGRRGGARPNFVLLWSLAVIATAAAFILYLALRSRAVELGYKLGRARSRQAQLRETRRVLEVEAVSYRTPERIEAVARAVLRLEEPPPSRIFVLGAPIEPIESGGKVVAKPGSSSPTPPSMAAAAPDMKAHP